MLKKFKFLNKKDIFPIPSSPGVYAFKNKNILYIGKAINIKKRIRSHSKSPFAKKSTHIGYIKTSSEIEAFILESNLIKEYKPKFNVLWRDDKNYFYVSFTKEKYPRIFLTHQPLKENEQIGPFIEGKSIKTTLKILKKIFPYYVSSKKHPPKKCSWCHLSLCPGPDPDQKKYKQDIEKIKQILKGKKQQVLKKLRKEMEQASKKQQFERALKIRDQIFSFQKMLNNARIISSSENWEKTEKELRKITNVKKKITRIESYDVSNIQGKQATGSMTVFLKGKPKKNLYRKFKIKTTKKPDDTSMIKEVLKRRFNHEEWPFPDLILIDGGKGQLNAGLKEKREDISFMALAKKENKLYLENKKDPILLKNLPKEISNLILYLRDEAHRFAFLYHKKLRRKSFRG